MALTYAIAQQEFAFKASGGAVTEPIGGSWLAAFAIWQGATEPNGTWLQTICEAFGITQPINGSWVQALANYYGITTTVGYGNWWIAIADHTFAKIPNADFTSDFTTIPDEGTVNFTDTSTVPTGGDPITAWSWTFAGGTPATSTAQNPSVQYNTPGTYDVTLEVTNTDGSNSITKTGYITVVNAEIVADFTADNQTPTEGDTVNFTDTSYGDTAIAWNWTFEGGSPATSTTQNPSVTYNTAGQYDVTLEVFDESGSNTKLATDFIDVQPAPVFEPYTINSWNMDTYAPLGADNIETNPMLILFK